ESPVGTKKNNSWDAFAKADALFICPTDPNTGIRISENNYRYNFGGALPFAGAASTTNTSSFPFFNITEVSRGNGAFTIGKALKVKDFPDGTSKTVFFAERDKGSLRLAPSSGAGELPTHADVVKG